MVYKFGKGTYCVSQIVVVVVVVVVPTAMAATLMVAVTTLDKESSLCFLCICPGVENKFVSP